MLESRHLLLIRTSQTARTRKSNFILLSTKIISIMENQELEDLKIQAKELGLKFSPNIGLEALKTKMDAETEEKQSEDEDKNFEKNCIEGFNKAISLEKDAYSEIFDIKKAKFIFWFGKKNDIFVERFVRSLVNWVKTYNLSIDKLTRSDIAFTEKSITVFPTRSPKPLSKREKDRLKQEKLKNEGY